MQAIPSPQDCCATCPEPVTTNIPGPEGPAGAACEPCADGVSAFTTAANMTPAAQPVMPYPIQVFSTTLTIGLPTGVLVSTATLVAGMEVTGTGIPAATTILSVDSATNITLSANATVGGAQSITYKQNVSVNTTSSTAFMAVGEIVFVQFWGYMLVRAITDADTILLQNIEDAVTSAYPDNAAQGTSLPAAAKIVPGGVQGATGALPGGALLIAQNLADLNNFATARANLSLLSMSLQAASAVAITGGTIVGITDLAVADGGTGSSTAGGARTNLGIVPGTDVQAYNALLNVIAALAPTVADQLIYTTGVNLVSVSALTAYARTILDDADAAAARVTLGILSGYGLLGSVTGVNMNVGATDTPVTMLSSNYIVRRVIVTNASISLTTATAGCFNTAGGVGTICADQAVSALTAAGIFLDMVISGVGATTRQTAAQLQIRVGTPQGAAATANFYIYGDRLD